MHYSTNDQRLLDDYFKRVEICLRSTNPADKAQIMAAVYQQVHSALDVGNKSVATVLNEIGNPIQLVASYREKLNLVDKKSSAGNILRWTSVAALFVILVCMLFGFLCFGFFSKPMLGFLRAHLLPTNFEWQIHHSSFDHDDQYHITEADSSARAQTNGTIDATNIDQVHILNYSGGLTVEAVTSQQMTYSCEGAEGDQLITQKGKLAEFNFNGQPDNCICHIKVPRNCQLLVRFHNGSIVISAPRNKVKVEGENGEILFKRAGDLEYKFDAKVEVGTVDGLPENPSTADDAIPVVLRLQSGSVLVE